MTTVVDVAPAFSDCTVAALGLAGWLGTMSPHTARAYEVDLRQFTVWIGDRSIAPEAVTSGGDHGVAGRHVTTHSPDHAAIVTA